MKIITNFQPALLILGILISATLPANISYADVTIDLIETRPQGKTKVSQYISPNKMRIDTVDDNTSRVTITDEKQIVDCTRSKKSAQKGACSILPLKAVSALMSGFIGNKGFGKITEYSVIPLNKNKVIAGRNCTYFKRIITTTMIFGGSSKITETICVDRSLAHELNELTTKWISPFLESISDPKLKKQALFAEKQASGITLSRESWTFLKTSNPADNNKKNDSGFLLDAKSKQQIAELEENQKKLNAEVNKPHNNVSAIVTKVIIAPIPPSTYSVPLNQYEMPRSK